jgi:Ca2+-binding RTX toxin-like protein
MTRHRTVPLLGAAGLAAAIAVVALPGTADAATTATFAPSTGTLTVVGDSQNNILAVSRDADGTIKINGGLVRVVGASMTVTNVRLISIFGQDGNDTITIDEAGGPLPPATLFGGSGNDVITGGSGDDQLFGQSGDDILSGKGGVDRLGGGDDSDTLLGGGGNDTVTGDAGSDRTVWNPGDATDVNEGGDGLDTVEVNGGDASEAFTATASGDRVSFNRVTPLPFKIDIGSSERLVLNAAGGNDRFTASDALPSIVALTVDGGAGNDSIAGTNGDDTLVGGDGNDTFQWNPGDGSDTVEGQAGTDRLQFNGASVTENMAITAVGARVRLTRDVGNVAMDLGGIERINTATLGGVDSLNVGDLTGTEASLINVNLGSDSRPDALTVNGTDGADNVIVAGSPVDGVQISGLAVSIHVAGRHTPVDQLIIDGRTGDDFVDASGLAVGTAALTERGGDGSDILVGSPGNDQLFGEASDDVLVGSGGQDLLDGGPGNNTVVR